MERSVVYDNNCIACHGSDGSANTTQGRKVKAHDLRDSRLTDSEIEHRIREGYKNKSGVAVMPAFDHELTDDQIKEVIVAVKSFRSRPAPAK